MIENQPLFSVVLTTYNHKNYIEESVLSILNQTECDFELIIVDDGSTDGTSEIISNYPNLKVIKTVNQGPSLAFNTGAKESKGRFLVLMSGDDVALPNRLQVLKNVLIKNSHKKLLFTHVQCIDDHGEEVHDSSLQVLFNGEKLTDEEFVKKLLCEGNFLCAPSACIEKDFFVKLGKMHPLFFQLQDYDLWCRSLIYCVPEVVQEITLKYRIHKKSLSFQSKMTKYASDSESFFIYSRLFNEILKNKDDSRLNLEKILHMFFINKKPPMLLAALQFLQTYPEISSSFSEPHRFWKLLKENKIFDDKVPLENVNLQLIYKNLFKEIVGRKDLEKSLSNFPYSFIYRALGRLERYPQIKITIVRFVFLLRAPLRKIKPIARLFISKSLIAYRFNEKKKTIVNRNIIYFFYKKIFIKKKRGYLFVLERIFPGNRNTIALKILNLKNDFENVEEIKSFEKIFLNNRFEGIIHFRGLVTGLKSVKPLTIAVSAEVNKLIRLSSYSTVTEKIQLMTKELGKDCDINIIRYVDLHPERTYRFQLPNVFEEDLQDEKLSVVVPTSNLYQLSDVNIMGSYQLVIEDFLIVYEPAAHPRHVTVAGMRHEWREIDPQGKTLIAQFYYNSIKELDEGILLSGRCSANFYHWMIEYVPKLYEISQIPELANIPIIIDDEMPIQHYQILDLIFKNSKINFYLRSKNEKTLVKKLWIPTIHTYMPDRFDIPFFKSSAMSLIHLNFLRNSILQNLQTKNLKRKKVFLCRGSKNRAIINESEILKYFKSIGFEMAFPHLLTFSEQVEIFNSACVIVGASGAGLSNLLYCKPGAIVLALTSDRNKDFCAFSNLAQFAGAKFIHITGAAERPRDTYKNDEDFAHASFTVSLNKIKRAVERLGI